ncbi:MAG: Crp/Fnr family transcriptional regulator [Sphingobacteriaceae bacterium]|nr:Crp/Fnr family transcriptional regulator [Sphingobacteriaceae bacterium]
MDTLKIFFSSQGFSELDAGLIAEKFTLKHYRKGDFFVEEGKTSKHLGYIEKGFLQYFIYLDGEEKTTYSIGANNFVASLVSFLKQVPSRENIRAIAESSIWMIDRNALNELLSSLPSFSAYYTGILEWQICCIDESRLDAIMLSAQERYNKMIQKEPTLIQQIPLQYLASILGVTPRHLSRIRNKVS